MPWIIENQNRDHEISQIAADAGVTTLVNEEPEKSWEIFASTSQELQNELNRRAWLDTLPRFALRPAAFDAGRYLAFQDFLAEAGLISGTVPISRIAVDVSAP